jgi:anti-sigma factor RsiW
MTRSVVHEDPTRLVHAYMDGELDPANALALETRMATDAALAAECERVDALQRLIRQRLPREALPPGLRARIEASVGMRRPRAQVSWRALAASIALTAMVASGATSIVLAPTSLVLGPARIDAERDAVVAGHIRSLMAPQPFDVASSDKHTVKPWFNGKIPEAPRVVDLAKDDFPLAGGRLDVVGQTPAPTLVYRHHKHLISLTAVPAAGQANAAPVLGTVGGYNVLDWTEDGIAYWAISDMATADLDKFAKLFRAASPDQ